MSNEDCPNNTNLSCEIPIDAIVPSLSVWELIFSNLFPFFRQITFSLSMKAKGRVEEWLTPNNAMESPGCFGIGVFDANSHRTFFTSLWLTTANLALLSVTQFRF